jgi:hypothetical protein
MTAAPVFADSGVPQELQKEIARLEEPAKRSLLFRRLLAETDGLPRRVSVLPPPAFVEYERPPLDRLSFAPAALKKAGEWAFQVAEARELARASMALPTPILEAELAAYQKELAFALEMAAVDPGFSKAWNERARRSRPDADPGRAPVDELERLAFFAALLAESPDRFYVVGERALSLPPDTVRLTELEDFLKLHASELAGLSPKPGEPYVRVGGRRYAAAVVKAAALVLPIGGAGRVREALGPADLEARELSGKLRGWLKWPVP